MLTAGSRYTKRMEERRKTTEGKKTYPEEKKQTQQYIEKENNSQASNSFADERIEKKTSDG